MKGQRPRRILRLVTRLNVGGPTRHVRLLQGGLDPAEFTQLLVHGSCEAGEGEAVLEVPGDQLHISDLRRDISLLRDRRALGRLRSVMKSWAPDLVHTHQGKAGLLGRRAAAALGIPAVHTYHGHTFSGYFGPIKGCLIRASERWAARRSRALICQSASQEEDVRTALGRAALGPTGEGRTRVIAPAFDPAALELPAEPCDLRQELGTPPGRKVVLLPARLVMIKRPDRALKLLAALQHLLDVELWVAGEGPLAHEVTMLAKLLDIESRVRWLGYRPSLQPLLAGADLVLLTSAAEGTPLALIEAMAFGVPVACTEVGGVADIIGDTGTLLPPDVAPESWAPALHALLTDEALLEARSRSGLERARREYSHERLVKEIAELYRGIL